MLSLLLHLVVVEGGPRGCSFSVDPTGRSAYALATSGPGILNNCQVSRCHAHRSVRARFNPKNLKPVPRTESAQHVNHLLA